MQMQSDAFLRREFEQFEKAYLCYEERWLRILSYNEEQISSDERADWNKDVCDRVLQYEHNL